MPCVTRDGQIFLTSISGVVPVETRTISRRLGQRSHQILAYAYLMESSLGIAVKKVECYHADNVLVHVPLDDDGDISRSRCNSTSAIAQAISSSSSCNRQRATVRCSLAPGVSPEELTRMQRGGNQRLFPKMTKGVIHVLEPGLL